MDQQSADQKKSVALPAVIIAAVLVVVAALAFNGTGTTNTDNGTVAQEQTTPSTETAAAYKDGTYTQVGEYAAPSGQEKVGITLTIKDGVITDAAMEKQAVSPVSVKFQDMFATGYKAAVVGKRLNEVQLDKVSGSSLTPKGFNDAVAKIKLEAKA